jgi:hypothetical protein
MAHITVEARVDVDEALSAISTEELMEDLKHRGDVPKTFAEFVEYASLRQDENIVKVLHNYAVYHADEDGFADYLYNTYEMTNEV